MLFRDPLSDHTQRSSQVDVASVYGALTERLLIELGLGLRLAWQAHAMGHNEHVEWEMLLCRLVRSFDELL